ncbi:MAG: HD domain-containing protein, partial [Actinomycetota bacterium]|nr:HD domain-containing protein [Actinomycetota bacterium]
ARLGGWGHLAHRLFQVAWARPLSPREQSEVGALLGPAEARLFWSQPTADQRHGLAAARAVLRQAPGRRDLACAALLHDVGKRRAALGPVGRSLASVMAKVGLPATGRWRHYLDHPALGAADLEQAQAQALVIQFARHHHNGRPEGIDKRDWELLQRADGASRKTRRLPRHEAQ